MQKRIGLTGVAVAGAIALGACTDMAGTPEPNAAPPAPATTAAPGGQAVSGTEFARLVQTGRPMVVTEDRRGNWAFTGTGNSLVYIPQGEGTRLRGTHTVRNNLYCINYAGQPDRCYQVYRTGPNTFTLWTTDNQRHAVVTVE